MATLLQRFRSYQGNHTINTYEALDDLLRYHDRIQGSVSDNDVIRNKHTENAERDYQGYSRANAYAYDEWN